MRHYRILLMWCLLHVSCGIKQYALAVPIPNELNNSLQGSEIGENVIDDAKPEVPIDVKENIDGRYSTKNFSTIIEQMFF